MDGSDARAVNTGTAYGMKPATYNRDLVEVGPGTPMGELMRRYWQPCFTSEDLTSDRPRKVRLLGEDLILFRDKSGRPGLMHEYCCHRGASLFYGRVEEDGIRCCYHGWKFDAQGHCLEQPAEIDGGRRRDRVRQPWYPVQERYGLVYAYMGPPEKMPVLPRWKHLENLGADEVLTARWRPTGPLLTHHDRYEMNPVPFNWLQMYENNMDGAHVPWLHLRHSGDQFTGMTLVLPDERVKGAFHAEIKDWVATMVNERTPLGVRHGFPVPGPDGEPLIAFNECVVPNLVVSGAVFELGYAVPVDDTHHIWLMVFREKYKGERSEVEELHPGGKTWWEMTLEEHQFSPGDYEAESSIGPVPAHSREHLSQSDAGVVMLRRRLEEAVRDVAEGRDPPGLIFDENAPPLETRGDYFHPVKSAAG